MANGQTVRLTTKRQRELGHTLVDRAPEGSVLNIREATRSNEQNSRMWAMLSDIARAKPQGRTLSTDIWKCLFMAACGHNVRFEPAIDGEGVVAIGFHSSKMSKDEMSDLISCIAAFGDEHGVVWSEPKQ